MAVATRRTPAQPTGTANDETAGALDPGVTAQVEHPPVSQNDSNVVLATEQPLAVGDGKAQELDPAVLPAKKGKGKGHNVKDKDDLDLQSLEPNPGSAPVKGKRKPPAKKRGKKVKDNAAIDGTQDVPDNVPLQGTHTAKDVADAAPDDEQNIGISVDTPGGADPSLAAGSNDTQVPPVPSEDDDDEPFFRKPALRGGRGRGRPLAPGAAPRASDPAGAVLLPSASGTEEPEPFEYLEFYKVPIEDTPLTGDAEVDGAKRLHTLQAAMSSVRLEASNVFKSHGRILPPNWDNEQTRVIKQEMAQLLRFTTEPPRPEQRYTGPPLPSSSPEPDQEPPALAVPSATPPIVRNNSPMVPPSPPVPPPTFPSGTEVLPKRLPIPPALSTTTTATAPAGPATRTITPTMPFAPPTASPLVLPLAPPVAPPVAPPIVPTGPNLRPRPAVPPAPSKPAPWKSAPSKRAPSNSAGSAGESNDAMDWSADEAGIKSGSGADSDLSSESGSSSDSEAASDGSRAPLPTKKKPGPLSNKRLAIWDKDVLKFKARMRGRAAKWGCSETYLVNRSGLGVPSTPKDRSIWNMYEIRWFAQHTDDTSSRCEKLIKCRKAYEIERDAAKTEAQKSALRKKLRTFCVAYEDGLAKEEVNRVGGQNALRRLVSAIEELATPFYHHYGISILGIAVSVRPGDIAAMAASCTFANNPFAQGLIEEQGSNMSTALGEIIQKHGGHVQKEQEREDYSPASAVRALALAQTPRRNKLGNALQILLARANPSMHDAKRGAQRNFDYKVLEADCRMVGWPEGVSTPMMVALDTGHFATDEVKILISLVFAALHWKDGELPLPTLRIEKLTKGTSEWAKVAVWTFDNGKVHRRVRHVLGDDPKAGENLP
ncbi:hypothetical protein AURDEDRAFT_177786, partial [Auricularia subglabra TFB-10046 SS5]